MAVELFSSVVSMSLTEISLWRDMNRTLSRDEFSLDCVTVPDVIHDRIVFTVTERFSGYVNSFN